MRRPKDRVFVKNLSLRAINGLDAWRRPLVQPLAISIAAGLDVKAAGEADELGKTLNYDTVSQIIVKNIDSAEFKSSHHIAESVAKLVLEQLPEDAWTRVNIAAPESLLRAGSFEVEIERANAENGGDLVSETDDLTRVNKISASTIIGVNELERLHRQIVEIDLEMKMPAAVLEGDLNAKITEISDAVVKYVELAEFLTVEAMAGSVAELVLSHTVEDVTVSVSKPSALTFASGAGVKIQRKANQQFSESLKPGEHKVFLAFGTNIGDQTANIQEAIAHLNDLGVRVTRTSGIYCSEPMYVQDQPSYFNGVFECITTQTPQELLKTVKVIEYEKMKRVKEQNNGPRIIDLDIVLYDSLTYDSENLSIPHKDMLNRSFVLQPLLDLVGPDFTHPISQYTILDELKSLPVATVDQTSSELKQIVPYPTTRSFGGLEVDPVNHSAKTLVMAIINVTPDSFSDGGKINIENIAETAIAHVKNGADILDIGGQSTRPGVEFCSEEEEIKRTLEAVKALRSIKDLDHIPISIDTFRSEVARQCIMAGANIINDVYSGSYDDKMFAVACEAGAPIILSHARGTAKDMDSLATYDNVVDDIAQELSAIVDKAYSNGLKRWQIILDPGIGFAKTVPQNLKLIRDFSALARSKKLRGLPWLAGASRKRFIGAVTDVEEAAERTAGSLACVTALVQQGVDIVRVHDVEATKRTCKMADAIYRNIY